MRALSETPIQWPRRIWNRAWFRPLSAFNFALFRTGLGIIGTIWLATMLVDLTDFFGSSGLEPNPGYRRTGLSIFRLSDADSLFWIGTLAGLAGALLLVAGLFVRVAGPVMAVVVSSLMAENALLWNGGDEVFQTFAVLFGLYCLATPSDDLDAGLRASFLDDRVLPTGRFWLFRLIQIQLTLVYLVTFIDKMPGSQWQDGTAVIAVLRLETLSRFYVPGWALNNLLFANLLTWASLALEGLLPVLLWNRRARPWAVGAAVLFHLGIDWALSVGVFSWIMILGHVSFLSSDTSARLRRWLQTRTRSAA